MGWKPRLSLTPRFVESERGRRVTGVTIGFASLGPVRSRLSTTRKPAVLAFHIGFVESAREATRLEAEPFATLTGSISRKGTPPRPVWVFEGGAEAEIEYLDPKLAESKSLRKIGLAYDAASFENAPGPGSNASFLKLPREPEGTRSVEVAIVLRIDGNDEADLTVNDRLDVPLPPPRPHPTETIAGGCFAYDLSLPTAAILPALRRARVAVRQAGGTLGVFAHADSVGSDAYNKELSDRRGRATLALLTNDLEAFEAVGSEETWDDKVYQAMLRGLGCNPGPIDGKPGAMTEEAVRTFREEYNADLFHGKGRPRARPDLPEGTALDDGTKAALRDAYVSTLSQGLSPSDFAGPKFSGCSEFVPISKEAKENRRVTLAIYEDLPPADEDFPCVPGDATACDLDGVTPRRCRFYRKTIREPATPPEVFFFDCEWLERPDGRLHLSALTNAPDGSAAEFRVFKATTEPPSPLPSSLGDGPTPVALGNEVGSSVTGEVVLGVAHATFSPPEGFDPFDVDQWVVNLGMPLFDDDDEADLEPDAEPEKIATDDFFHPPLFRVQIGDAWAYSDPPGERLARFVLRHRDDPSGAGGLAIRSDGSLAPFATDGHRILEQREVFVVGLGMNPAHVIDDGDDALG